MTRNSHRPIWRRTEWLWLGLALFLHSLLLLIPFTPHEPGRVVPQVVNLRLAPFLAPDLNEIQTTPVKKKSPSSITDLEEIPRPEISDRRKELPTEEPDLIEEIDSVNPDTAAEIFQLLRDASLDIPTKEVSRRLGAAQTSTASKGSRVELFSSTGYLNGMFAPAAVEITDRWLAADGSHNVVVNLPTGDTVCGRALAWNAMQPLVEHVMMFRPCGGGGKRSFTMDSPYSHRNVINNP